VASEYGEQVLPSQVTVNAGATSDVLSFTLPSAGVWEIDYSVRGWPQGAGGYVSALITDNSNTAVSNSEVILWFSGIAQVTGASTVRITTTGATTYKLRATSTTSSSIIASDNNGRTKVVWKKISGFTPLAPKSFTETLTIGATTTAPTKGATKAVDYINLVDDNSGWCQVSMMYRHTSAGTAGSGDYLFSLPAGYKFDTTIHPGYTFVGQNSAADPGMVSHIPGSRGEVNDSATGCYFLVVVYDATRFRLLQESQASWWGTTSLSRQPIGSGQYGLSNTTLTFNAGFRFKKG
jgi:hypothetical protein